jgi:hypothetical protein
MMADWEYLLTIGPPERFRNGDVKTRAGTASGGIRIGPSGPKHCGILDEIVGEVTRT